MNKIKPIFKVLFFAFILKLVVSFLVWHPDVNNHIDWGIRFWQYGPAKFYAPESNVWSFTWPNQPPGTMYMFAAVRKLYEVLFAFFSYLHFDLKVFPGSFLLYFEQSLYPALTKLPGILSDLGIAYVIYKIIFKELKVSEKVATIGAIVFLINPATWYNSTIWGQYDSVINFLALLAFYFLLKRELMPAILAISISLYIKASLLIFLPIFAVIALRQKYNLKKWLIAIVSTLFVIGLITLPFSNGEPFVWLLNLYKDKVFTNQLQIITANAFNLWAALTGISEQPQTLPFLGLTFQYWSYILFLFFFAPVLVFVYRKQDFKTAVWSLAITAFASFMLLTNMHERYLYPVFPYFTILVATQIELVANYTAVSIISLLNMYNFWWMPLIPSLVAFMSGDGRIVPRVLGAINLLLFIFLYIRFLRQTRAGKI